MLLVERFDRARTKDGWARKAMLIVGDNRMSTLAARLEAAPNFQLSENAAKDIIDRQIGTIRDGWDDICEEAELTEVERNLFGQRLFLNDFIFKGGERWSLRTSTR